MDAGVNSNKVTVEYTDPSNVFPLIRESLESRLPLQSLHWKSPTRPLRSIDRLDIEFLSDQKLNPSSDSDGGSIGAPSVQRRHQIPGLRQTPYAKLYFLKCDETDTYKAQHRKLIREWSKKHGSSSKASAASSQENHDAFEWIIVQISVAAPPAASQSYSSSKSMNLFEKIRTDFNSSSKSSFDHVARIIVPPSELPDAQGGVSDAVRAARAREVETCWENFITRLKSSILSSFDLRVSQYEEDIKEKDSQRNLPGWNFCTFFILKEGLARGFESMGLVEDALVGYDELSHGFEIFVAEETSNAESQQTGTFLPFTKSLYEEAKAILDNAASSTEDEPGDTTPTTPTVAVSNTSSSATNPISSAKKPYRDLILANDISFFDFRCYLFSRQLTLLLRAANVDDLDLSWVSSETLTVAKGARKKAKTKIEDKSINLPVLAEICQRAAEFSTITARTMRKDLETSLHEHGDGSVNPDDANSAARNAMTRRVVDNMVSSWIFSVVDQVLHQTDVAILVLPPFLGDMSDGTNTAGSDGVPGIRIHPPRPPPRSSSLPPRPMSLPEEGLDGTSPTVFLRSKSQSFSELQAPKTGEEELAARRADLFTLSLRILSRSGKLRGWATEFVVGQFSNLASDVGETTEFEDVSLDEKDKTPTASPPSQLFDDPSIGVTCVSLKRALENEEDYFILAEDLIIKALRHFIKASRTKSTNRMLAHLGVLKYSQARYEVAASYLRQAVLSYADGHWVTPEDFILQCYATCLKRLGRLDDYVRICLKVIAKQALRVECRGKEGPSGAFLHDIITSSSELAADLTVPLKDYFDDVEVDRYPRHYEDRDGFMVGIRLRNRTEHTLQFEEARLQLVCVNPAFDRQIELDSTSSISIPPGRSKIMITSKTSVAGLFTASKLLLRSGKITFVSDLGQYSQSMMLTGNDHGSGHHRFQVYCFPAAGSLDAELQLTRSINLGTFRILEIKLTTGWNHVKCGEIRVKPGSAGLRVKVTETKIAAGEVSVKSLERPGTIEFGELVAGSTVSFAIPYSLEVERSEIMLKIEVSYTTEKGEFLFVSNPSVNISLPLGVNVQDVFKEETLFSRFTISCAGQIPLRLFSCKMTENDNIEATPAHPDSAVLDIYPRQPVFLLYRFKKKQKKIGVINEEERNDYNDNDDYDKESNAANTKNTLSLTIVFECLDEVISMNVKKLFEEALIQSPFWNTSRLIVPAMISSLRLRMGTFNFESTSLLRELRLGSFDSSLWNDTLRCIAPRRRKPLMDWLMSWHEANQTIPLPESKLEDAALKTRELIIPVDIPGVEFVHTAELNLCRHEEETVPISVGCAVDAELKIRFSRKWQENLIPASNNLWTFSYELQSNPDTWLVGGRKRASFTMREHETCTLPVVLIPQRPGHLLLPGIDIRTSLPELGSPVSSPRDSVLSDSEATATPISTSTSVPCEIDYRNNGESVLVLPDLKSTTISIDPESFTAGFRLTGSERRNEAMA